VAVEYYFNTQNEPLEFVHNVYEMETNMDKASSATGVKPSSQ